MTLSRQRTLTLIDAALGCCFSDTYSLVLVNDAFHHSLVNGAELDSQVHRLDAEAGTRFSSSSP